MISRRKQNILVLLVLATLVGCNGDEAPLNIDGGADGPAVLDGSVASGLVGPAGGTLTLAGGRVKLEVPPGAVKQSVTISALATNKYPADSSLVAGTVYDLLPDGLTFQKKVKLSIAYDKDKVPKGVAEAGLRIHKVAGGAWQTRGGSVDTKTAVAWTQVTSFSIYGVKGPSTTKPDSGVDASVPKDVHKPDAPEADMMKSDAPKTKPDLLKPDAFKPDALKPDAAPPPAKICPGIVTKSDWCWHRPLPQGNALHDVACAGGKAYLVGGSGTVLVRDGTGWKASHPGTDEDVKAIWAPGPSDVYVASKDGVYHHDGTAWSHDDPWKTGTDQKQ